LTSHISTLLTALQPLRPYQSETVEKVYAEWTKSRRVLLVAPTGAGKTRLAEEFVVRFTAQGQRVVFIAHRRELIRQAAERLRRSIGVLDVGLVAPGEELCLHAPVQVATVQTLLARSLRPEADLIILDEAHHYVADDWSQLAASYPHAKVLGLTATPERQDGRPMGDMFESLVVAAKYSELIRDGHLVPCRVFQPPADFAGDGLAQDPIAAWQRYADGARTFWFCRTVEDAYETAKKLCELGIPAACIEAKTEKAERDELLDRFARGGLVVLTNVYALTEGVDVPAARCCLLARSCGHVGPYLQMAGRVLRPHKDKADAILIDLSGATLRHGLPTEDREYSLEGNGIRRTSPTPLRNCLQCGATFPSYDRKCPECGYEAPQEKKHVRIYDLELQAVFAGAATPGDAKQREYRRLRQLGKTRGWSLYFVQKEYKKLFGELPIISDASIDEQRDEYVKLTLLQRQRGFKPGFVSVRFKEMFGSWPSAAVKSAASQAQRPQDA